MKQEHVSFLLALLLLLQPYRRVTLSSDILPGENWGSSFLFLKIYRFDDNSRSTKWLNTCLLKQDVRGSFPKPIKPKAVLETARHRSDVLSRKAEEISLGSRYTIRRTTRIMKT